LIVIPTNPNYAVLAPQIDTLVDERIVPAKVAEEDDLIGFRQQLSEHCF